jgi:hypothetical protein
MDAVHAWLERAGAQHDVVEWARAYGADFARLWAECPRGDWLLAIAARLGAARPQLVLAAASCARLALAHVSADEARPLAAVTAAEAYGRSGGDAAACAAAKLELAAALDAAADAGGGAAIVACMAALDAIDDADAAVNAAAFAAQAAVLDAGDCAMMEALRFTQRRSAQLVRDSLPSDAVLALWNALHAS